MKKEIKRMPRCPHCHKTPIYCMCGGYNPRTNKYENNNSKKKSIQVVLALHP